MVIKLLFPWILVMKMTLPYFHVIYEWTEERLSLQGKPDSWPSNSVHDFLGSKARISISWPHSCPVWASSSDGKVISIILRQMSLQVNRDTAVESQLSCVGCKKLQNACLSLLDLCLFRCASLWLHILCLIYRFRDWSQRSSVFFPWRPSSLEDCLLASGWQDA